MTNEGLMDTLLAQERAALDRWARGDTPGYAATLAEQATYFDHVTRERLQGRAAIASHVRAFEGQIDIPRHEIVNPALHHDGALAILAFNWDAYDAGGQLLARWNATSAYRRVDGEWRIIHTHWSMVPAA
jgi:ketosteroid isomerase-like protein